MARRKQGGPTGPSETSATRRRLLIGGGVVASGLGVYGLAVLRRSKQEPARVERAREPAPKQQPARAVKLGTIIGGLRYFPTDDKDKPAFSLCVVDLDSGESRSVDFGFFAHGFAPDPTRPQRAVFMEKKGPGACEVDLLEGRVLRVITSPPRRHFYGHGAFTADGGLLLAAENDLDTYKGLVVVRDGKDFTELGVFPTFGMNPHDCQLIDDGKTVAITNGGAGIDNDSEIGAPSVTFVELESRKLLEKLTFSTKRLNAGHLAFSRSRDVVAVSAPREGLAPTELGGITIRNGDGTFETLAAPPGIAERMIGETLSVAIHEPTGVVGATNPSGNLLTFWDLATRRFLGSLDFLVPRGITKTLDESHLVVSIEAGGLFLLSPTSLTPEPEQRAFGCKISGSHIYAWNPYA